MGYSARHKPCKALLGAITQPNGPTHVRLSKQLQMGVKDARQVAAYHPVRLRVGVAGGAHVVE